MIDRDAIANALGFSRKDIDMVLDLFVADATASLEQLDRAVEQNDLAKLLDAAHAIKGSAGNFKLEDLYEEAMKIEAAAKAGLADFDYETGARRLRELLGEV